MANRKPLVNNAGQLTEIPTGDAIQLASGGIRFSDASVQTVAALGTVTTASVVSANGFAGSVATASTTPAITVSTTVTGLLKGNGSAVSAAVAGTDYIAPSNKLSALAATTSAELAGVITDETGTGSLVFGTSPNITTPTGIVKGDVGLGNVDNTSDANKPISTATQTALNLKRDITSIVPIVYGGTGAADESDARANLGVSMTSLYSGGVVTNNGTTYSVAAGLGYIVSQTLAQVEPTHIPVNFSASLNITPLYLSGVVYVTSAGTILQADAAVTPVTAEFKKQNIILVGYTVVGGTIIAISKIYSTPISTSAKLEDFMEAVGPLNISGNIYSANGANLLLNKTSGKSFQIKSNIETSLEVRDITTDAAQVPLINAATFYGYRNGTGGFTLVAYTGVTPNLWDDGSGTPATVSNNKFTIQRVYFFNTSSATIIYLGQTEYSSLTNANADISLENRVVDNISSNTTFRASIVIKKGTTDLTSATDVSFHESSKFNSIGTGSASSIATLQGAYNNSTTPEIVTDATLGALTVKRGSAADTDNVFEGKNGAGTTTFSVTGNGGMTVTDASFFNNNITSTALNDGATGAEAISESDSGPSVTNGWSTTASVATKTTGTLTNVTVAAAGKTFTRAAGSFVTDGFAVGQIVTWSGFANSGNNISTFAISTVTATVMTFSAATGLVNEAAGVSVTATTICTLNNVAVNSGTLTYTRTAGSWLSDGFLVGQIPTFTNFANAGNNISTFPISTLTATVMTLATATGLVTEAAGAVVTATLPVSWALTSNFVQKTTGAIAGCATATLTDVTVAAAGKTYTRSTGSFLTDGFVVGQFVTWAGFANAGNNISTFRISTLTATVMTFSAATGLVDEAAGASVTCTSFKISVNAAAKTFTRSSLGSFLTDGYANGQIVTWSGFSNAGNNISTFAISGITATVMTLTTATGLVDEASNGTVACTLATCILNNVAVNATSKTYTRVAGSWITDGFAVGMIPAITGFANAGNNVSTFKISTLTATVMTLTTATGQVTEAAGAVATFIPYVYSHPIYSIRPANLAGYAATASTVYLVTFSIVTTANSGTNPLGSLLPSYGGANANSGVGQIVGSNVAYSCTVAATTTGGLIFTPNAFWQGYIYNISVKPLTLAASVFTGKTVGGTTSIQMAAGTGTSFGIGVSALRFLTAGSANNLGIGNAALSSLTVAAGNTAFGSLALRDCTTGATNLAIGANSLRATTTGFFNIGIGNAAGQLNVTGSDNTVIGGSAMFSAPAAVQNTFIGRQSAQSLLNGNLNVGIGYNSLNTSFVSSFATAIGAWALGSSGSAGLLSNCVGLGYSAGRYNTAINKLYIDAFDRFNIAGDNAGALITGTFSAVPTNQTLTFNATTTVSNKLLISKGATVDVAALNITGSIDNYLEAIIQNTSATAAASSDFVVAADTATPTTNFADFGINSSVFSLGSWTISGALDAYLYSSDSHLTVGTASAKDVIFHTGGTLAANERLRVTSDGRLYGKALHNNAGAVTGATNQYIASGTYTPTLTNVTNVAASTARLCTWTRVGNVVTVSGQLDIDLTTTLLASEVDMSLPVASAFTTAYQLGGNASAVAAQACWAIQADAANDRAQLMATGIDSVTNDTYTFHFTYEVL